MQKEFIYADAKIHAKENYLLNNHNIEALIYTKDTIECLRLLEDKGWNNNTDNPSLFLKNERVRLWELIEELSDDLSYFDVFRLQTDYHNIKASIKAIILNLDPEDMLIYGGTINLDIFHEIVKKKDLHLLPEKFRAVADNALKSLLNNHDSRICDNIIDKQCLNDILEAGINSKNKIIQFYAETFVIFTNVKIAVRCFKSGFSLTDTENSLSENHIINSKELSLSALNGINGICDYLKTTVLSSGSEFLSDSISAFEKWYDNFILDKMKSQKNEHISVGPLFAYIIAKENEIKAVRLILSAKQNHLDENIIKERLRDMYV